MSAEAKLDPGVLAEIVQEGAGVEEAVDDEAAFVSEFTGDAPTVEKVNEKASVEDDPIVAMENRLMTRMRNVEGHLGGLKDRILKSIENASAVTADRGVINPSTEQIAEAAKSNEKFEALKTAFPEWSEALEEQFALIQGRVLDKIPQINVEELKSEVGQTVETAVTALRETIKTDIKFPGWEKTVSTPEFTVWMESQDEATQKLAESSSAADAISMLSKYKDYQEKNAAPNAADQSAESRQENEKRLEESIAPTKGAQTTRAVSTDEDDFVNSFNS